MKRILITLLIAALIVFFVGKLAINSAQEVAAHELRSIDNSGLITVGQNQDPCFGSNYQIGQNPLSNGYRNVEVATQNYIDGSGDCVFDVELYVPNWLPHFKVKNTKWRVGTNSSDVQLIPSFTYNGLNPLPGGFAKVKVNTATQSTFVCVEFDIEQSPTNLIPVTECHTYSY